MKLKFSSKYKIGYFNISLNLFFLLNRRNILKNRKNLEIFFYNWENKNEPSFLKNKRKKSGIEDDLKQIRDKINEKEKENNKLEQLAPENAEINLTIEDQRDKTLSSNESPKNSAGLEKDMFFSLYELIRVFCDHFKNKSSEEILDTLSKTSGQIQNAYLYLTDPNEYKSKNKIIIFRLEFFTNRWLYHSTP